MNKAKYKKVGIEIPEDVLIMQLNNLMDGIENKDVIKIADTLEYEICNTVDFYNELLQEGI